MHAHKWFLFAFFTLMLAFAYTNSAPLILVVSAIGLGYTARKIEAE